MKGKVYLVGAGPGDPELLTLKAMRVLKTANYVLYDRLVNPRILELTSAKRVYVGKEIGEQDKVYRRTVRLMKHLALSGYRVVRLKGGDPFILGRGAEEMLELLSSGIPVEVIPGVSSCTGVTTASLIPLTYRNVSSSFCVVSGRKADGNFNWEDYSKVETLVVLMGAKGSKRMARSLIESGRDPKEPVAVLESVGWEGERVYFSRLEDLSKGLDINPPAVIVVGKCVEIGKKLREEVLNEAFFIV